MMNEANSILKHTCLTYGCGTRRLLDMIQCVPTPEKRYWPSDGHVTVRVRGCLLWHSTREQHYLIYGLGWSKTALFEAPQDECGSRATLQG